MSPKSRQKSIVKKILDHLIGRYGLPMHGKKRRPLDSLIATILSQNTSDTNSERAFASLKKTFPNWSGVLAATDNEVEEAIRMGGLARQKSKRIRRILLQIQQDWGRLSLAGLKKMDSEEALSYLLSFQGVGRKTAACVLLFSLDRNVFPVDTHIFRVTGRLGWLPEGSNPDKAHDQLAKMIPSNRYFEAHINLIAHGRNICQAQNPKCDVCPICKWCRFVKEGPEKYVTRI